MPTAEERNRTAAAAAMFRLYIYCYTLFLALIYTAAEPAIRRTIAGILVVSPVFGAFCVVVVELEPDVSVEGDALVDAVVDGGGGGGGGGETWGCSPLLQKVPPPPPQCLHITFPANLFYRRSSFCTSFLSVT